MKREAGVALLVSCVQAEGAGDQLKRAVANEGRHEFHGEFRAAHLAEHGVDGGDEVELGIDQRTVQIEKECAK
jgi:hypothetical protein